MFSFFNKKKSQEQSNVPDWAPFFTPEEYAVFIKSVNDYFIKLNIQYEINDGAISVGENDFGFKFLGLQNIAQMCKQNKINRYGAVVKDHFETMIRIHKFDNEFNKIISDFEKIEKYIAVRLYDTGYTVNLEEENFIKKDFAEDIVAMLVFDLPESVINIKPDQTKAWGKTMEELFETGIRNTRKNYSVALSENKVNENMIWFAEADHFFASGFVFDIKNYPQVIGSFGSLVSIPNRHTVIIYPIQNLEVMGALNDVLYLTTRMHEDGPGSITDKLYWYKGSEMINLPHRKENGKLIFSPPQVFIDALNDMGQKKD